jgi:hypothetical protein
VRDGVGWNVSFQCMAVWMHFGRCCGAFGVNTPRAEIVDIGGGTLWVRVKGVIEPELALII